MTPIKLADFLEATERSVSEPTINLETLGLYHAAPRVNGAPLLALRWDSTSGCLMPALKVG